MRVSEIGIGIIFFPELESVLESNLDLINAVEIEPQMFWLKSGLDSFFFDKKKIEYLRQTGKPFIFHGVGFPVGGSIEPNPNHLPCLLAMMKELSPRWMSEHLSFNQVAIGESEYNTNFLLPPLQTKEGVETAVNSIKRYKQNFPIPFAFETGVNYLSTKSFEMEDGAFVREISEKADCSILLDLHNLLANQKNGRQKIEDFIKQIPLERVIEIHLADGFYHDNYYLDAHSGIIKEELFEIAEKIVRKLPNLKAIMFEMLPEYLRFINEKDIAAQLCRMNRIWDKRGKDFKSGKAEKSKKEALSQEKILEVVQWEQALGRLVLDKPIEQETDFSEVLREDNAVKVIKQLSGQFKNGSIYDSLRFTCRYIQLNFGDDKLEEIFREFWRGATVNFFPSDNGLDFADFLLQKGEIIEDRFFADLVRYEKNMLLTLLDGKARKMTLSFQPSEVVIPLADFELPVDVQKGKYKITIKPDNIFG
jgi:uncharacterized protein (UPF0276 family)